MNFKDKDIIFHGNKNMNELIIHWFPTDFCNYKCSYCISSAPFVNKGMHFTDLEILKSVVDKIFNIKKDKYIFQFSGGEPTIYPFFKELINYITSTNKNTFIYLFSNGHKSEEYFDELFQKENFFLNFSIHLEFFNINHLKKIIKCANKYYKYIMCSLMLNPDKKNEYISIYNELLEYRKEYFFGIDLGLIHDNKKLDSRYTKEDIEWFLKSQDEIEKVEEKYKYGALIPNYYQDSNTRYILSNTNNEEFYIPHREAISKDMKCFKDLYCCSGVNSISINAQGNYKGVECEAVSFIGNIYNEDIDYINLVKSIKCPLEGCECRINNYAPKYKNINDANECIEKVFEKNISKQYLYYLLIKNDKTLSDTENRINLLNNKFINLINTLSWCIPIRKVRDKFRDLIYNDRIDK